jgi:hypothetical protein
MLLISIPIFRPVAAKSGMESLDQVVVFGEVYLRRVPGA